MRAIVWWIRRVLCRHQWRNLHMGLDEEIFGCAKCNRLAWFEDDEDRDD
jgi:hypothetical protein